jgi:drug/metabolite transporter (DMT)-like permease
MSSPPIPRRATLTLGLLTGVMAASTAAIFIRLAQAEGAASIVIAAARLTIASLVLAPFALAGYRSSLKRMGRGEWGLALLSGLFLALHFASWITSLEYTSVASSVVLVTTTPLWVALAAPLLLHERMGRTAIIGLVLALAGGITVGVSDVCTWQEGAVICPPINEFFGGRAFLGDFLALFGAWMAAGYLLAGRKLRVNLPLLPYIFIVYGMAAIVLVIIMLAMGKTPLGLPPPVYGWFLLLALIPQLLGHSLFNWTLKYLPASFVSVTLLGEPIGSTVLAYLIFQETPGWPKVGGALLLLAGIWLAGKIEMSDQKMKE